MRDSISDRYEEVKRHVDRMRDDHIRINGSLSPEKEREFNDMSINNFVDGCLVRRGGFRDVVLNLSISNVNLSLEMAPGIVYNCCKWGSKEITVYSEKREVDWSTPESIRAFVDEYASLDEMVSRRVVKARELYGRDIGKLCISVDFGGVVDREKAFGSVLYNDELVEVNEFGIYQSELEDFARYSISYLEGEGLHVARDALNHIANPSSEQSYNDFRDKMTMLANGKGYFDASAVCLLDEDC